nr:uncharacterized protein LOC123767702 isoform X2 [Procambarus clarkii]
MELVVYSVMVLSWCVSQVASLDGYDVYHLGQNLCEDENDKETITIGPWKAAIIKVGHLKTKDGLPVSHKIHKCKVTAERKEDFGLAAVIEEMKIQASVDKRTNGWVCDGDYVKLSTSGTSFISKLLDSFPWDTFKSKSTEELCGLRKKKQLFSEIGANANVFSTVSSNLEVYFHQSQNNGYSLNNSFTIVITAFKYTRDKEACQGKFKCTGNENFCIDQRYMCDNHLNCGFPSGGGDEVRCSVRAVYQPVFSTTTTIITALAGVVGAGLVICCLFTIIMKAKSRSATPSGTPVPPGGQTQVPSAPALQRQHTLPPYEAVVMSDANQSWKSNAPPCPEVGEYPPSYEMLFPEGPPKEAHAENGHTGDGINSQGATP